VRIREARIPDLPQVLELLGRLHAKLESYVGAPLDRESLVFAFGRCVNDKRCAAFVAEHEGALVGVLLGITQELWFSTAREALDLVTYSERAGAGPLLVRRFARWAERIPRVVAVSIGQTSGLDDAGRYEQALLGLGFKRIGFALQRPVSRRVMALDKQEAVA
jgi:hypothetical protein